AVNSRGGFFSAADPKTFSDELTGMIGDIMAVSGSATAVKFDVASFETDGLLFSAQFDSNGWTGDLKAVKVAGGGAPVVPEDVEAAIAQGKGWSAKKKLDDLVDWTTRTIVTYSGGKGTPFAWANLSNAQKSDLNFGNDGKGEQRLAFIRGDR